MLTVLLSVEFCRNFRMPIHPPLGDIQGPFTSERDYASFGEATAYHVRIARVKLLVSVGFSKYHN